MIFNLLNNQLEKMLNKILIKTVYGKISITIPSGKKIIFSGSQEGAETEIIIKRFSIVKKILKSGSIGFAEAYIDNDFSTKDLSSLLVFAKQNEKFYHELIKGKKIYNLLRKISHKMNENTQKNSKKNISYHYDLGNDFYKLWLDKSMTYSSALFNSNIDCLEKAQINKFRNLTQSMNLNDNSTLLEIGCGWGGFSTFVAKNFGVKVNAITISKEQFDYTSEKIFQEGLNDKINIQFKDYRDIDKKFDNIASIEMFEAVGKKYWPVFFEKIRNCLNPNGLAALQIITINNNRAEFYQSNPDFIQKYIFPGGVLPSKTQLYEATNKIGLKMNEIVSFGSSYSKTLQIWNSTFQESWKEVSQKGFSEKFKRMWEYYFSYCQAGFILKTIDVSQFTIKK